MPNNETLKQYAIDIEVNTKKALDELDKLQKQVDKGVKSGAIKKNTQDSVSQIEGMIKGLSDSIAKESAAIKNNLSNSLKGIKTGELEKQFQEVNKSISSVTDKINLLSSALNNSDFSKFENYIQAFISPMGELNKTISELTTTLTSMVEPLQTISKTKIGAIDTKEFEKSVKELQPMAANARKKVEKTLAGFRDVLKKNLYGEGIDADELLEVDEITAAAARKSKTAIKGILEEIGKIRGSYSDNINELLSNIGIDLDEHTLNNIYDKLSEQLGESVRKGKQFKKKDTITMRVTPVAQVTDEEIDNVVKEIATNISKKVTSKLKENESTKIKVPIKGDTIGLKKEIESSIKEYNKNAKSDDSLKVDVPIKTFIDESSLKLLRSRLQTELTEGEGLSLNNSTNITGIEGISSDVSAIRNILSNGIPISGIGSNSNGQISLQTDNININSVTNGSKKIQGYEWILDNQLINQEAQNLKKEFEARLNIVQEEQAGYEDIIKSFKSFYLGNKKNKISPLEALENNNIYKSTTTDENYAKYGRGLKTDEFRKELKTNVSEISEALDNTISELSGKFSKLKSGPLSEAKQYIIDEINAQKEYALNTKNINKYMSNPNVVDDYKKQLEERLNKVKESAKIEKDILDANDNLNNLSRKDKNRYKQVVGSLRQVQLIEEEISNINNGLISKEDIANRLIARPFMEAINKVESSSKITDELSKYLDSALKRAIEKSYNDIVKDNEYLSNRISRSKANVKSLNENLSVFKQKNYGVGKTLEEELGLISGNKGVPFKSLLDRNSFKELAKLFSNTLDYDTNISNAGKIIKSMADEADQANAVYLFTKQITSQAEETLKTYEEQRIVLEEIKRLQSDSSSDNSERINALMSNDLTKKLMTDDKTGVIINVDDAIKKIDEIERIIINRASIVNKELATSVFSSISSEKGYEKNKKRYLEELEELRLLSKYNENSLTETEKNRFNYLQGHVKKLREEISIYEDINNIQDRVVDTAKRRYEEEEKAKQVISDTAEYMVYGFSENGKRAYSEVSQLSSSDFSNLSMGQLAEAAEKYEIVINELSSTYSKYTNEQIEKTKEQLALLNEQIAKKKEEIELSSSKTNRTKLEEELKLLNVKNKEIRDNLKILETEQLEKIANDEVNAQIKERISYLEEEKRKLIENIAEREKKAKEGNYNYNPEYDNKKLLQINEDIGYLKSGTAMANKELAQRRSELEKISAEISTFEKDKMSSMFGIENSEDVQKILSIFQRYVEVSSKNRDAQQKLKYNNFVDGFKNGVSESEYKDTLKYLDETTKALNDLKTEVNDFAKTTHNTKIFDAFKSLDNNEKVQFSEELSKYMEMISQRNKLQRSVDYLSNRYEDKNGNALSYAESAKNDRVSVLEKQKELLDDIINKENINIELINQETNKRTSNLEERERILSTNIVAERKKINDEYKQSNSEINAQLKEENKNQTKLNKELDKINKKHETRISQAKEELRISEESLQNKITEIQKEANRSVNNIGRNPGSANKSSRKRQDRINELEQETKIIEKQILDAKERVKIEQELLQKELNESDVLNKIDETNKRILSLEVKKNENERNKEYRLKDLEYLKEQQKLIKEQDKQKDKQLSVTKRKSEEVIAQETAEKIAKAKFEELSLEKKIDEVSKDIKKAKGDEKIILEGKLRSLRAEYVFQKNLTEELEKQKEASKQTELARKQDSERAERKTQKALQAGTITGTDGIITGNIALGDIATETTLQKILSVITGGKVPALGTTGEKSKGGVALSEDYKSLRKQFTDTKNLDILKEMFTKFPAETFSQYRLKENKNGSLGFVSANGKKADEEKTAFTIQKAAEWGITAEQLTQNLKEVKVETENVSSSIKKESESKKEDVVSSEKASKSAKDLGMSLKTMQEHLDKVKAQDYATKNNPSYKGKLNKIGDTALSPEAFEALAKQGIKNGFIAQAYGKDQNKLRFKQPWETGIKNEDIELTNKYLSARKQLTKEILESAKAQRQEEAAQKRDSDESKKSLENYNKRIEATKQFVNELLKGRKKTKTYTYDDYHEKGLYNKEIKKELESRGYNVEGTVKTGYTVDKIVDGYKKVVTASKEAVQAENEEAATTAAVADKVEQAENKISKARSKSKSSAKDSSKEATTSAQEEIKAAEEAADKVEQAENKIQTAKRKSKKNQEVNFDSILNMDIDHIYNTGIAHQAIFQYGKEAAQQFIDAPEELKKTNYYAWESFAEAGVDAVKDALGISSPSKVFEKLGEYCGEGFKIGLTESFEDLKKYIINALQNGIVTKEEINELTNWNGKDDNGRSIFDKRKTADKQALKNLNDASTGVYDSIISGTIKESIKEQETYNRKIEETNIKVKDLFRSLSRIREDIQNSNIVDDKKLMQLTGDANVIERRLFNLQNTASNKNKLEITDEYNSINDLFIRLRAAVRDTKTEANQLAKEEAKAAAETQRQLKSEEERLQLMIDIRYNGESQNKTRAEKAKILEDEIAKQKELLERDKEEAALEEAIKAGELQTKQIYKEIAQAEREANKLIKQETIDTNVLNKAYSNLVNQKLLVYKLSQNGNVPIKQLEDEKKKADELRDSYNKLADQYRRTYGKDAFDKNLNTDILRNVFSTTFGNTEKIQKMFAKQIEGLTPDKSKSYFKILGELTNIDSAFEKISTKGIDSYILKVQRLQENLVKFLTGIKDVGALDKFNKIDSMYEKMSSAGFQNDKIDLFIQNLEELKRRKDDIFNNFGTKYTINDLDELIRDFEILNSNAKYYKETIGGKSFVPIDAGQIETVDQLANAMFKLAEERKYSHVAIKPYTEDQTELTMVAKTETGQLIELTAAINKANSAMYAGEPVVKQSISFWKTYSTTLKQAFSTFGYYLGFAAIIRRTMQEFRQGIQTLKTFDSALTTISYTMNLSQNELKELGRSAVDMAEDLSMSMENALKVYQIYANMQTTAKEIEEVAKPTAILSNLSGVDASTAADQVQGILQQFNMLKDGEEDVAETSMHVVDVLDKISANIAVDYSKGISIISEAVTATGQVAHDAGMSFEELAAITAKVAERTREDGSTIGNAMKTMFVRISKVSKMPQYADEVDNEEISKAAKALHDIGIEVYNTNGEFNNITDTLSQLNEKWDSLNDVQKSNISFQIAATRQSAKFKSMLEAWTGAMDLANEATNANGNALENQEKFEESYAGKMQRLQTEWQEFWLNMLNSDGFKGLIDALTKLIEFINELADKTSHLGVVITGLGLASLLSTTAKIGKQFLANVLATKAMGAAAKEAAADYAALAVSKEAAANAGSGSAGRAVGNLVITNAADSAATGMVLAGSAETTATVAAGGAMAEEATTAFASLTEVLAACWPLLLAVAAAAGVAFYKWYTSAEQVVKRHKELREELNKTYNSLKEDANNSNETALSLEKLIEQYKYAEEGSEEYYAIANQIAELSPNLVTGYTNENNAILKNVEALEEEANAWKDVAKRKKEAARREAQKNLPELLQLYNEDKDRYNQSEEKYNKVENSNFKKVNDLLEKLKDSNGNFDYNEYRNEVLRKGLGHIVDLGNGESELVVNEQDISVEEMAHDYISEMAEYSKELAEQSEEIHNYYIDILDFSDEAAERNLENDKSLQNVRNVILSYADEVKMTGDELQSLYEDSLSNNSFVNAVNKFYSLDMSDMPYEETIAVIKDFIDTIINDLELPESDKDVLLKAFGFDRILNKKNNFLKKYYGKTAEAIYKSNPEVKKFVEENNQLTSKDYDILNSLDYKNAIEEYKQSTNKATLAAEDYLKVLEKIKKTNGELKNESWSKGDMIDKLTDMSGGFDKLDEIYADIYDKGSFDFAKLGTKKFEDAFGNLGLNYEDFIETVSGHTDDLKYCQEAFNSLVDEYIRAEGILDHVTEANADVTKSMLEMYGITNANELVQQALINTEAKAIVSKYDLADATKKDTDKLLEEIGAADGVKASLIAAQAAEVLFGNTSLNADKKISDLNRIAAAAWGAAAALEFSNLTDNRGYDKSYDPSKYSDTYIEDAWNKIEAKYSKMQNAFIEPIYGGGKSTKDAIDKANKSGEESKKIFDWIEKALQRQEEEISRIDKVVNATYKNWSKRNSSLLSEINEINKEIAMQQTAYQAYLRDAEAIPLSEEYKKLVREGAMRSEIITDKTLQKNIDEYEELYDKAIKAKDAIADLEAKIASLAKAKFDNVKSEFEGFTSEIEHFVNMIDKELSYVENMNKIAGKSFYRAKADQDAQKLEDLNKERTALLSALREAEARGIEEGSADWISMRNDIYSVDEAIAELTYELEDLKKKMKEVAKLNFDDLKSQFENAISIITGQVDLTDTVVSMTQNAGYIASKSYYEALISGSKENVTGLRKELETLVKTLADAMNAGDIEKYSEEW